MSSSSSITEAGPAAGGLGGKHVDSMRQQQAQAQQVGGRPTGGRQTSSMGEQSGRQGEPPARECDADAE